MLYQQIGLVMKVQKHLHTNPTKAAFYFAALMQREGGRRPEEGTAEFEALQCLKKAGFRFRAADGHVVCERPDGRLYDGVEALAAWNAMF
jgi:hypothetical protein